MADDIVAIINAQLAICEASPCDCTCPILIEAAAEIERLRAERDEWQSEYLTAFLQLGFAVDEIEHLRAALALAVGELSTHGEYTVWTPEMLMNQFLEEARRG